MLKTAIISGITGQDGCYLSQLLLSKDYHVIGLTRNLANINKKRLEYLQISDKIIFEECDLLNSANIQKVLSKYNPSEFYNLSAQSSVGVSFEQPFHTITYNITSVLNILEEIRVSKFATKFFHASSCEMYGNVKDLPINSDTPLNPQSPYAISKTTSYEIVNMYRNIYGVYTSNGILFPHESYLRGTNFFIKKVLKGAIDIKKDILKDLHVGNIDIKRDFGYAPNYVEAMYLSLQQERPDDYFICSGTSVFLRDIIEYVFNKLNISTDKIIIDPQFYRPAEIVDLYGDNAKTKQILNWNYQKSFFDIIDILLDEEIKNYN